MAQAMRAAIAQAKARDVATTPHFSSVQIDRCFDSSRKTVESVFFMGNFVSIRPFKTGENVNSFLS
jgi:hypothetical protein